ncbi:MAG: hypothetical protein HY650_16135 [Acidobacteria bacterium]|nr:hypothetical protein [Acidobacteriota bacterium]
MKHLIGDLLGFSMQRVVKRFGDDEEGAVTLDHIPSGFHAKFAEQGNHAGENLGHATADGGGVWSFYILQVEAK